MNQDPALDAILTDRYRVVKQLGQGGMATVYLADDLKLDRQVALKVLSPELGAVLGGERFLAEIKISARLDHPHILTLIDSGNAGGRLFYVLPYVRGESLRDLMRRETQIGVHEAVAITKQVASALDYAHRNGVVHRDIKPENILLQEGEAMLADFGIALAVKEAGGDRLTQTGLSLGTPQYMSPEQATGDRRLDGRSDVYSLAAVLYEMLVGDPPVTGATVQTVIAKLLTETPTRVRVVRPSVPLHIDNAIAKALSKVPSDRFTSAGEFVKALESDVASTQGIESSPMKRGPAMKIAAAAGVVALGVLGWMAATGKLTAKDTSAALRERRQLTTTGNVLAPAMSPDAKQLAYFVRECKGAKCTYAVQLQDVGNPLSRRILDGIVSAFGLEWSADRRNLIVGATVGGRSGAFLISALGGPARLLTPLGATFFAGGDSLLMAALEGDSAIEVRVAGLDGAVRRTMSIRGAGTNLGTIANIPGTPFFVTMIVQNGRGLWQVIDRATGKVTDRLVNSCTCGGTASHEALWMTRAGPTVTEAVVRVAVDAQTGKLATHQDTIYNGRFTSVSVSEDDQQMAVDDGSINNTIRSLSTKDALAGSVAAGTLLSSSTSDEFATISPDGNRILMMRSTPGDDGRREQRLSVRAWPAGAESPLSVTGRARGARWVDSTTIALAATVNGTIHLSLIDVRTGAISRDLDTRDSTAASGSVIAGGWAWLNSGRDRIVVDQGGKRREIAQPKGLGGFRMLGSSADGTKLLYGAYTSPSFDSVALEVVPLAEGPAVRWFTHFADGAVARWLSDGSIALYLYSGPETMSLLRITGPGKSTLIGDVQHVVSNFTVSDDLKRATLAWSESRADVWLYRVVKP